MTKSVRTTSSIF